MAIRKSLSIKDIARVTGVAPSTVSRVLNGKGRFSDETRRKVLELAGASSFQPNSAAKSLRAAKSDTIGVIVSNIDNEWFAALLLEVERFFFGRGYSVFICNTDGKAEKELSYLRSLDSKMVDGLICIAAMDPLPTEVLSRNIPIVYIDRIEHELDDQCYLVSSDHRIGGFLATEELIRSGAKRILLLTKQRPDPIMAQRFAGYCDALQKYGIALDDELVIRLGGSRPSFDEARDAVHYSLAKGLRFDGVFGVNDWRAYGALVALHQNGIAVPREVKVVGFDDSPIAQRSMPPLSTIYQDRYAIAGKACELLYELIAHPGKNMPRRTVIPVSLIPRQTT